MHPQVLRRPGPALLAFLLGVAIGVMGLLSIAELWIWNAIDNGPLWVTVFVAAGAALFYVVHPYFPDFQTHPPQQHHDSDTQVGLVSSTQASCVLASESQR